MSRSRWWILPGLAAVLLVVLWPAPAPTTSRSERGVARTPEPKGDPPSSPAHAAPVSVADSSSAQARAVKRAKFEGIVHYRDCVPAVGLGVSWSPKGPFSVTDTEGRFTWEGKHRSTTVFLDVGPEGYFPLGRMEVGPDGIGTLEIDRGFPVGGTVRAARGGTPLPGALVILRRMGGHTVSTQGVGPSTKTDEAGRFSFPFLPAGTYSVLVSLKGYEPLFRAIDVVRPMGDEEWLLGEPREMPVRIEADGEAWENATFVVQVERWQDRGYFEETKIAPEQRSGALVPAPPPGWYRAKLLLVRDKRLHETSTHEELLVESGPPPTLTFRIPAGGAVTGRILLPGGRPLQARPAQLRGAGFSTNLETDDTGAFRIPFVPDGTFQIRVFSGTGFRYGAPFTVAGGADVTVRIDGSAEIWGRVEPEPSGAFESPVEITRGSETVAVVYHREGRFSAEWLEPGCYSVRVAGEAAIDVELAQGESHDVGVLRAAMKVLVPIRIDVPAGADLPELVRFEADGIEEAAVPLDARGCGLLHWPAGRRRVVVRARQFRDLATEILVEQDPRTPLRLTLARP